MRVATLVCLIVFVVMLDPVTAQRGCIGQTPGLRASLISERATLFSLTSTAVEYDQLYIYLGGTDYTDFLEDNFDTIYRFEAGEPLALLELPRGRTFNAYARYRCNGELQRWSDRVTFNTPDAGPPVYDDPGLRIGENVAAGLFYGTTLDGTSSDTAATVCGGAADDDVFLYLLRPFPADTVIVAPYAGTDQDLVVEVRDNDRSLIACYDQAGDGEAEIFTLVGDRNALNNYQLRIYTKGAGGFADFTVRRSRLDTTYVSDGIGCVTGQLRDFDGEGFAPTDIWRDVVDSTGKIIASIQNFTDAGEVRAGYYKHSGPIREAEGVPYLSRNIYIQAERPLENTEIRLFLLAEEVEQLIAAGGIDSIEQLTATRQVGSSCSPEFNQVGAGLTVVRAGELFGVYYIDVRTGGASNEFFFHARGTTLRLPPGAGQIGNQLGCTQAAPVTFDGSGAPGEFISIDDRDGGRIVSIENTQPLGEVNVSYFRTTDALRLTVAGARYAGRNLTIVPQSQPADTVWVRLYMSQAELNALLFAGAIDNFNEINVTKVPHSACSVSFPGGGERVPLRQVGRFGFNYFLEVGVTSFSEFFVHGMSEPLTSIVLNDRAAARWEVFPNPVGDRMTLTAPDELLHYPVTVDAYTVTGRQFAHHVLPAGRKRYLNTGDWPRGVYSLIVRGQGRAVSLRVVK